MKRFYSTFLLVSASSLPIGVASLSSFKPDTKHIQKLEITNSRSMFNPGDEYQFKAALSTSNKDVDVNWSSSNPSVGNLSGDGYFKAFKNGKTTITASINDKNIKNVSIDVSINEGFHDLTVNNMGTKAMVMEHEEKIEEGKPFIIKFVSAKYIASGSAIARPIHCNVKMSDLEILYKDDLINSKCTLVSNYLTIPEEYTDSDITINYLGAEIADWIKWSDITSISDNDTKEEKRAIQDFFSLGDYKKVYKKGELFSRARIIDFYHDRYKTERGGVYEETDVPTTWEMYEQGIKTEWGCTSSEGQYGTLFWLKPWNDGKVTVIRLKCITSTFDNLSTRETIKISEGNSSIKTNDKFFVGSYAEYTDEDTPDGNDRDTIKGKDGKLYAYYDERAFISTLSREQRRIKKGEGQYFTRLPWSQSVRDAFYYGDRPILINAKTGAVDKYSLDANDSFTAYLMFTI